ncbi:hypothetical protein [Nostoc sp. 'Lobaria pulmonaria (5183) cyanobiont']|uniref:hypothetical protein n=1 Tax=Nostoc sp. 'Lobaria pulmonaria (5183) cyanobiont' TaxID=1618022 RepID=UPI000CF3359C|nr:hypothetical protein [Nostoc sp. 'Lobaria pulmonaria (5183) cyanobiont']AVH73823.1 hypothetical protein NLP_5525 [Nostoc sp. 'Lobaria pulmonaria (5183) cyanobiont']
MGWCISGNVVIAPHQAPLQAIFYNSENEPQITYHSNSSDQNYWGYSYTSFNYGSSFVDGSYTIYQSDEASCQIRSDYDCINGKCIIKTQYNTPGVYKSLSDCQAVCANGGACASGKQCVDPTTFTPNGKVCIDQGEFASIEALISKIGSEVC